MVRYHWFIRLRWIMAFSAMILYCIDRLLVPDFPRPSALPAAIMFVAIINVIWTVTGERLLKELRRSECESTEIIRRVLLFANAQMTVDLLLLTVILRFSGGIENPMAIFYTFHMLIAALLMRPLNAIIQGTWAVGLYALIGFGECLGWIRPHWPFIDAWSAARLYQQLDYVVAKVLVMGVGIFGTLYFALQIASRLDYKARQLHEAHEAIQLLQERRSRFMQTAAHQLKGPLTGIEMLAGLIRDGVALAEQIPGIVDRIVRRCREAVVQVTELLTLERLEVASTERHRSARTDLCEVLDRVAAQFADQIAASGLDFKVESVKPASVWAAVDPFDLEICISNLLDNAIRYTPKPGHVRIGAQIQGNIIHVSVSDSGMGIAEESMKELFEPFRRGNLALARNIPGSGLGLSIVKEVAEQAGGGVKVQSTLGEGSTFVVSFPVQHAAPAKRGGSE